MGKFVKMVKAIKPVSTPLCPLVRWNELSDQAKRAFMASLGPLFTLTPIEIQINRRVTIEIIGAGDAHELGGVRIKPHDATDNEILACFVKKIFDFLKVWDPWSMVKESWAKKVRIYEKPCVCEAADNPEEIHPYWTPCTATFKAWIEIDWGLLLKATLEKVVDKLQKKTNYLNYLDEFKKSLWLLREDLNSKILFGRGSFIYGREVSLDLDGRLFTRRYEWDEKAGFEWDLYLLSRK